MVKIICKNCGKEFWDYPSNHRKYCSIKCKNNVKISEETRIKLRESHKNQRPIFGFGKNHPAYKYWQGKKRPEITGKRNNNWKGGKIINNGYIQIKTYDHPFRDKQNYIFEHRLIAEKCLGRYLTKEERIHHINEIKDDNRPENLYLFTTNAEHYRFHSLKNKSVLESNLLTI